MSAIDGRPRTRRAHRVPPKRRCEDKCMPAVLAWLPGRPARLRDRRCTCNEPYPSTLGRSPRAGRAVAAHSTAAAATPANAFAAPPTEKDR